MKNKPQTSLTLGVFAKYWEPGQVKTRLAKTIGNEAAAKIHFCLLEYLLNRLCERNDRAERKRQNTLVRQILCVSPARNGDEFKKLSGGKWKIEFQSDGDLGMRMRNFFEVQFRSGASACVLVGSDCPDVDVALIDQAFEKLKGNDLVLGPALDGGYYLIGMNGPNPQVFENMPWSGSELLKATISRAESLKLAIALLDKKDDIDTQPDLMGWLDRAKESGGENRLKNSTVMNLTTSGSQSGLSGGYQVLNTNDKRIDVVRRIQKVLNLVKP